MAVLIYLGSIYGNVDISANVNYKSINITDSIQVKADTLSFDMTINNRSTKAPEAGNTILILDTTTEDYAFSGQVETVREEMLNPITFRYSCDCIDWTRIFDRHLVNEKFGGETVKEIINVILKDYANKGYGNWTPFTYNGGGLDDMKAEESLNFEFLEPSACLDQLAEKTGGQWYIDFDRVLYFNYAPIFTPSPISENELNLDIDVASYGDMVLTESIGNLKNVVFVADAKVKEEVSKMHREDGAGKKNQYYKIGFIMFIPTKEADLPSFISAKITDQTSSETLIRNLTDIRMDNASRADETNLTIYVNQNGNSVRLPDKFLLGASDRLIVTAYEAIDLPAPFPDPVSIDLMKARENLGSDGMYEYKKSEPALWDANQKGQEASSRLVLNRYSMPLITGEFYSYLSNWRAGMGFTMKSQFRMNGKFRNGVVMFVKSVTKTIEVYGNSIVLSKIKSEVTISNNKWEGS